MRRFVLFAVLTSLAGSALSARAQDAVQVAALAPPDAFSAPGRQTGLPGDLWKGASLDTVQAVLPKLATKPLSPAAAALARRVLATGAAGPTGAGGAPELLAARGEALIALGDVKAAAAILAHAPGLDRNAALSRAAAESALLAGDDASACAVAQALTEGREDVYWLRLRTYCLAIGGHADQAQLTFELAQSQTRDPVFGRLMGAKLAGGASPGEASLRNGLDLALSRSLSLDLSTAKASPAVAAARAGGDPAEPSWTFAAAADDRQSAARALASGNAPVADVVLRLMDAGVKGDASAQAAALLVAAYVGVTGPDMRGRLAALSVPEPRASVGRNLAMDEAGDQKLMGETAMLALWNCIDAGVDGPSVGERARIIRALKAAGLDADARNFAVEGLLGPPAP